jgi:CRISPR/Cas system CMR-associated protein Cmr5 small subunit
MNTIYNLNQAFKNALKNIPDETQTLSMNNINLDNLENIEKTFINKRKNINSNEKLFRLIWKKDNIIKKIVYKNSSYNVIATFNL